MVGPNNKGQIFISPLGSFVQYIVGSSPKQEDTTEGTEASLNCFKENIILEKLHISYVDKN